jgi:deoxyribose-phosphate aldolase
MAETDVQRIVDLVVQRVRERMGDGGSGHPCDASCSRGAAECTGCGHSVRKRPDDARRIIDLGAARVGAAPDVGQVRKDLAPYIDHTLLKAEATRDDLRKLCDEARTHQFASVCVNSGNVRFCKSLLQGTKVMTVAVVGFPLGAMSAEAKAFETKEAVRNGADEIDMVLNIGALKSRDYLTVFDDIRKVVAAAAPHKVKVILETGTLSAEEKVVSCALSKAAGAAFVKTSTGFGAGGATAEDVALMRRVVGKELEVKASGGVRTAEDADVMIKAGATRIGASASVAIVSGTASQKQAAAGGKKGGY